MKVEKLDPFSRGADIIVKVVSKGEIRDFTVRNEKHRVADALVGDGTGSIYLALWDDSIDKMSVGNTIQITDGYVNLYRGSMRLNIGRYGSFKIVDESPIADVNTKNNLSLKHYRKERRYRMLR